MLTLDGSVGEGGGQILRTSLSLSMITGRPFRIERIRAGRRKPGILRQHLAAIRAAAEISSAQVTGAALGSSTLAFAPAAVKSGDYHFDVGSAGSCTLVLQTVLPALLHASGRSTLTLRGGTHNPAAPPYEFLQRTFLPLVRRMGAKIDLDLVRHGFYPAGGGEIVARIEPVAKLGIVELVERGAERRAYAESLVARIPEHVAKRELDAVGRALGWPGGRLHVRELAPDEGPGNALLVTLEHEHVAEVFSAFGERGVRAEDVAKKVVDEVSAYLRSDGAAGGHLADQLLVPMALAGGGRYTTSEVTPHTRTNVEVIKGFVAVEIAVQPHGRNAFMVTVRS